VSGNSISWAICKSAPRYRQITMPALYHSVFYRTDVLPAAQPTVSKHWRLNRWGEELSHLLIAYSCNNICTKNYWNRTTTVKIIIFGWMVYFFETQCIFWLTYCAIQLMNWNQFTTVHFQNVSLQTVQPVWSVQWLQAGHTAATILNFVNSQICCEMSNKNLLRHTSFLSMWTR